MNGRRQRGAAAERLAPIGFGHFELDRGAGLLRDDGRVVHLRPRTFTLLCYLVERAGSLVHKDELLDTLWPNRIVADAAIKNCVRELRSALGDDASEPRYIATVHRRGYRFMAAVTKPRRSRNGCPGAAPATRIETELAAEMHLAVALAAARGWGAEETGAAFARAWNLSRRVADSPLRFPILWGRLAYLILRGRHEDAYGFACKMLAAAERSGEREAILEALLGLGTAATWLGQFVEAVGHYAAARHLYKPEVDRGHAEAYAQDPRVTLLAVGALDHWALGAVAEARRQSAAASDWARTIGHPYSLVIATVFAAMLAQLEGHAEAAGRHADAARALAREHGFPMYHAMAEILRGWATSLTGEPVAGIDAIKRGIEAWHATGARWGRAYFPGLLADACRRAGRARDAVAALKQAESVIARGGERFFASEIYRLHAEIVRSSAPRVRRSIEADAAGLFRTALDLARSQRATTMEHRVEKSQRCLVPRRCQSLD